MLIRLLEPSFSDRWHRAGEVLKVNEGHPLVACHKALRVDDDAPIFTCPDCGAMFVTGELLAQHAVENGCRQFAAAEPETAAGELDAPKAASTEGDDNPLGQAPPAMKKHGRRRGVMV